MKTEVAEFEPHFYGTPVQVRITYIPGEVRVKRRSASTILSFWSSNPQCLCFYAENDYSVKTIQRIFLKHTGSTLAKADVQAHIWASAPSSKPFVVRQAHHGGSAPSYHSKATSLCFHCQAIILSSYSDEEPACYQCGRIQYRTGVITLL